MNKFSFSTLFLFLLVLVSCNETNTTQIDTDESSIEIMYTEVMKIHDDIMPRMSDINHSKDVINEKLTNIESYTLDSVQIEKMKESLNKLKVAEDAMWDWMHSFSDQYGQLKTFNEKETFLVKEKESITIVRNLMLESIEESSQFIDN